MLTIYFTGITREMKHHYLQKGSGNMGTNETMFCFYLPGFKIPTQTAFLVGYPADGSNVTLHIQTLVSAERLLQVRSF